MQVCKVYVKVNWFFYEIVFIFFYFLIFVLFYFQCVYLVVGEAGIHSHNQDLPVFRIQTWTDPNQKAVSSRRNTWIWSMSIAHKFSINVLDGTTLCHGRFGVWFLSVFCNLFSYFLSLSFSWCHIIDVPLKFSTKKRLFWVCLSDEISTEDSVCISRSL